MNTQLGLDRCFSFINCQLQSPAAVSHNGAHRRAVTISRRFGSGGHTLAKLLAEPAASPHAQRSVPLDGL